MAVVPVQFQNGILTINNALTDAAGNSYHLQITATDTANPNVPVNVILNQNTIDSICERARAIFAQASQLNNRSRYDAVPVQRTYAGEIRVNQAANADPAISQNMNTIYQILVHANLNVNLNLQARPHVPDPHANRLKRYGYTAAAVGASAFLSGLLAWNYYHSNN